MKTTNFYCLFLLLIFSSCSAQKENSSTTLVTNDSLFTILNSSVRDIYPGMNDGKNHYRQKWTILVDGPSQVKCNLFFLLKGYQIPIGELGAMGIVIGSDRDSYQIAFELNYPLEANYPKSELEEFTDPVLLMVKEKDQLLLQIKELIILEPIIYPSAAH